MEFIVLASYGVLAGQLTRFATRPAFTKAVNLVAGTMLLFAAFGLVARQIS